MQYPDFKQLIVCRPLLDDPVVRALTASGEDHLQQAQLAAALLEKAEELGLSGLILRQYILYVLAEGDNIAARTIEKSGRAGRGLAEAMRRDMAILWPLLTKPSPLLSGDALFTAYEPAAPVAYAHLEALDKALRQCHNSDEGAAALLSHYCQWGRGRLARYEAFCLSADGTLVGIDAFPSLAWADLIGYADQKGRLLANTRQFMAGKTANNVLLTGARGTGKSTAVKALIPLFSRQGLRLVELGRDQLQLLPTLMNRLGAIQSKKFIVFFDDLSFDEDEKEYKYLKSAIDGGVTPQPDNVLLYATSNRRHLLKETWRDRGDALEEEVYRQDSTNESISLSDRFGLIIHYPAPTQQDYLAIIDHELCKKGVHLAPQELRVLAVRWEMEHSGRNGRIAKQFVRAYLGNLEANRDQ